MLKNTDQSRSAPCTQHRWGKCLQPVNRTCIINKISVSTRWRLCWTITQQSPSPVLFMVWGPPPAPLLIRGVPKSEESLPPSPLSKLCQIVHTYHVCHQNAYNSSLISCLTARVQTWSQITNLHNTDILRRVILIIRVIPCALGY